ncbi:MAG: nuclear transport factor 2 family protein [Chloroflexota bacterium]|jgi:hypothetical protein
MTLEGKGYYIWQVRMCEKGNAEAIANVAQSAGLTHILIKVADGIYPYNYDWKTKTDLAKPVVQALKERGIKVWGWQYVYGEQPLEEGRIAVRRVQELGLEGFSIDVEREYEDNNKKAAANRYMNELRANLKDVAIAISSYRFPSYHTLVPWREFLNQCDYNMPQVYWMKSHNPGEQLRRCVREFQEIKPFRPIIPTGSAFSEQNWTATASEILEFLQTAQDINLSAANFWSWDYCRNNLPNLWNVISDFPWGGQPEPSDITKLLVSAINAHAPIDVANLYHQDAVHITAERTIQGTEAIRTWYQDLFKRYPQISLSLSGTSGSGASRAFNWTASLATGKTATGSDTLGLLDGKISYHYSTLVPS